MIVVEAYNLLELDLLVKSQIKMSNTTDTIFVMTQYDLTLPKDFHGSIIPYTSRDNRVKQVTIVQKNTPETVSEIVVRTDIHLETLLTILKDNGYCILSSNLTPEIYAIDLKNIDFITIDDSFIIVTFKNSLQFSIGNSQTYKYVIKHFIQEIKKINRPDLELVLELELENFND